MYEITPSFVSGALLPCWLPLHCKVLTPSQEPRDQGEKPNAVPVSFNTPNTPAWNNWTSTSHRLLVALLLSLFVLPFPLNSHFISVGYRAFFLCFSWLRPHMCYFVHFAESLGDNTVNMMVLEVVVLSVSCWTWISHYLWNTGTDSWVLLPPGDVCQQQRLPPGNEGGQDHGLWCGPASLGQEAWRLG